MPDPRPVLVTTKHRGVFYGRLVEETETTATLEGARCAIYWGTTGGFLQLAATGPTTKSRIGARSPRLTLRDVTSVSDVTPAAAEAWERA